MNCYYGRFRLGLAVRDTRRWALSFPGLVFLAITAGFYAKSGPISGLLGLGTGLVLLTVWSLMPWAWRHHWYPFIHRLGPDEQVATTPSENAAALLGVLARHDHVDLRNPACVVTGPRRTTWTATIAPSAGTEVFADRERGNSIAAFYFPTSFMGPARITPGRYRVRWTVHAEGRRQPLTIARGHWCITESR